MGVPGLGEAATRLSWVPPCAASLTALARSPTLTTWEQLRTDPGAVLLVFRHAPAVLPADASFLPLLLRDAAVLETALRHLDAPDHFTVDWHGTARPIYQTSTAIAAKASRLAQQTGRADPELAWVAGLLAPLGWLAVSAVDATQAAGCLADLSFHENPTETQRRWWGYDQASIARRLARRWQLPSWLAAIVGHLGLPARTAQKLGADLDLFRLVQAAVGLVQNKHLGLALTVAADWSETASDLDRAGHITEAISEPSLALQASADAEETDPDWAPPASVPLLRELLCLAAENRRLADAPVLERLEAEVDQLQHALEEQRVGETERLRSLNLGTLAEFAAGAGHEINNPLAVISGQAQYLLGHETEPARQRALHTIIGQTQRIHDLLTELMQFARPARPQKRPIDLGNLIREVTVSLGGLAEQRKVRLVCPEPELGLGLCADPRQLRVALTCLLRNAIEAAPADGWAGVRVAAPTPERLELLVEDSGDGPAPGQREHMFDPFYSGRQAGRGRGLGLPTAWRLARENGGMVAFDELSDGPTRFVLSLPRETGCNGVHVNGHAETA